VRSRWLTVGQGGWARHERRGDALAFDADTTRAAWTVGILCSQSEPDCPVKSCWERDQACELVSLQIAVLTMNRGASLLRLLTSLSQASYGCATVDLLIAVDKAQLSKEHTKVLAIATEFRCSSVENLFCAVLSKQGFHWVGLSFLTLRIMTTWQYLRTTCR